MVMRRGAWGRELGRGGRGGGEFVFCFLFVFFWGAGEDGAEGLIADISLGGGGVGFGCVHDIWGNQGDSENMLSLNRELNMLMGVRNL